MTLNPHIQSDYAQLFESTKSGAPKLLHLVYEGGKNASDLDFDSRTAFRELAEDGVLSLDYGRIRILDNEALARIASE